MSGESLRQRVSAGVVLLPGVWDALSAKLCAAAGFEAMFVSGFAVSGTSIGAPDIGLLTQTEVADVTARVCAAVPGVDVVVDADTGYGGALNIARTVRLWERAGASGAFIEDQVFPKRCGHMTGKQVIEVDEWLSKLRAACDARTHLHITARTDARGPLGLDQAIERGRAARDLGVDAVFVEAPAAVAEMEQIASALPDVALVANMVEHGRTPLLTPAELAEMGFRIVVAPVGALFTMTKALRSAYGDLHEHGTLRERLDRMVSFDEFTTIVDLPAHLAADERARS